MKVWLITGTSSGFGRAWAEAALERGDQVAATSLRLDDIADLSVRFGDRVLPVLLNVDDREGVFAAVATVVEKFGRIDVVVNNAGYGLLGMIEEFTEQQARAQIDTNLFGSLWVIQAVLPVFRAQKAGRLLQISSIGGLTAYPIFGMYNASKWAVEGMATALAGEVRPFGISVTLVEPVGYATPWWGSGMRTTTPNVAYADQRRQIEANWAAAADSRADPAATCADILRLADMADPPLRVLLGAGGLERVTAEYSVRLDTWQQWESADDAAKEELTR